MHGEVIQPIPGNHNMTSYEEACANFRWEDVEKEFSWYTTGKVNIAYEAVDRNVLEKGLGDKVCLYYSDPKRSEEVTYRQMMERSNQFANVLKKYGIGKGERVFIFMPRSPELYASFLGIIKSGGIAGPLFEAFMEGAVKDRLADAEAIAIITTPALRNRIPKEELPHLKHIFIVDPQGELGEGEIDWRAEMAEASTSFDTVWVDREDPMLLLYTSGSTGKPKGVLHVHNGMIQHYQTGKWVLDFQADDIYWCTADPGWVTGISYGVWAPYLHGVSSVIRGGRFSPRDWYKTLQDKKVTIWYSAPTAFRMLMSAGDDIIAEHDLSNLRHILSVGEPLNPEVVRWGERVFNVRIHDNWWMTETGGQVISNYPCMPIKPGSMGKPFPGIHAAIVDDKGNELPPLQMGNLAIRAGWPSMMRQIWNNPKRYEDYFRLEGWYVSGDSAYMDEEGYFWFQGRVDDVINTSGERVGPFEVESRLVEHPAIAEAGVIGKPDPVRGEVIKAFIALREGYTWTDELRDEIVQFVKTGLAAHAAPREIEVRDKLPKTRSGKIMRRVLKAWELGLPTGDLSTLED
ncbi:acetate--CoA ligase [Heliophilum fasciatum]|uniref:acetate--CoA ligase n=1 Tax=Heliophilum fasciatum TaxID=35700 RepID=A0A4R2RJ69_9FIRM|nr:acetate--CoA ligase [Heliophilum fasciatum]MCW2278247.1 acetyl-CoA synthetase [Heliophilum fasciatum]TCP63872.1 acetyl-CoA synthetase [Heliophilum fasciatum]